MERKDTNPKEIVGVLKPPLSVIPTAVIAELGVAMLEGALKYGRHNYRAMGVRASVYYDATMRHLNKWWDLNEDTDVDSGLSHITKAISSLTVLRDSMIQQNFVDDRPPVSKLDYAELEKKVIALHEKYKEPVEHYTRLQGIVDE